MALPLLKSFDLLQNQWKSILDPIVGNPIVQGRQLNGVVLSATTATTVPHGLSREQRGWFLTDVKVAATIFRTGNFNASNMVLTASVACTVDIWVY